MAQQENNKGIDKAIFRAYDIRGIYPTEFNEYSATLIGRVLSKRISEGEKVVVAMDGRTSSQKLKSALIEGLVSSGVHVVDCGMLPTPFLYFASRHLNIPNAFMITGSHNPKNYNGIKMIINNNPLYGRNITALYEDIENLVDDTSDNEVEKEEVEEYENTIKDYVEVIKKNLDIDIESKIIIDCMNGVTGKVVKDVMEAFDINFKLINNNVDGSFPKHSPDPTKEEYLEELKLTINEEAADYGVAFDGDGDRLVIVKKNGECIWPDELMILFSKSILKKNKNSKIVYDVKCTRNLRLMIESNGGVPIESRTGHSFIKKKIQDEYALLGGELSGHIFFNDKWYGFDDGIYVFLRFVEIMTKESELIKELNNLDKTYSTPEIDIEFDNIDHHSFMKEFKKLDIFKHYTISNIDGIKISDNDCWGLVRASNTSPKITLRFEATTIEKLNNIKNEIKNAILKINNKLDLPF